MKTPEDIVASIFRKFKQRNLTPDFIREESNRICEALNIPKIGDPGRVARLFAEQGLVKKDNPLKANFYFYEQEKNKPLWTESPKFQTPRVQGEGMKFPHVPSIIQLS